jgi:aminoglycoside 3-N-acetyltransferase
MIRTSSEKLKEIFRDLGVRPGSALMVHSSLFSLGYIEGGVDGFYKTLINYLGPEGTLIVPAFTYSFRRNQIFDKLNSPPDKNIGVFSSLLLQKPNAFRSSDPMFSLAAIGARASELLERDSNLCFGTGSIYSRLFDENITFMAIGITYSTGLTGFVHLEKLAKVPYREDQEFSGISIADDGQAFQDSAIHYSRREDVFGSTITKREHVGSVLEKKGACRALTYGYGRHLCLEGHPWRDIVLDELEKNPFCMLDSSQYSNGRMPC